MSEASAKRSLADHLVKGGLDAFVAKRRPDKSWQVISRELMLATKGKVLVTPETLRVWFPEHAKAVAS